MKRFHKLIIISALLFIITSCEKTPRNETIPIVSQFVYDGLSTYYLWNDEMIGKKPTINDNDPKKYFYNTLYKTDTDNKWSWITDDTEGLLASFAGESKTFGYSIGGFIVINDVIYAVIRYVFDNTPASRAGMQRLDLIGIVDGQPIKSEKRADGNYYVSQRDINILNGVHPATFATYKYIDGEIVKHKGNIRITPIVTKTDPVLFDKVYTIGDKTIGYLFYTNFTANYNYRLFEVFNKFKNAEVTDLILDLRYNPGGGISAASYLVSLFAPEASVKDKTILTTLSYNKGVNNLFDSSSKLSRNTRLGTYQDNNGELLFEGALNPLEANIDLNKVYIIATDNSASASELTTFCSRAIMGDANVVHIGGKTSGKYTASWTIHPYSDNDGRTIPLYVEDKLSTNQKNIYKNWAMQPIVAIYTDKDGNDFANPGYLEPNYPVDEGFGDRDYIDSWRPIGDTEDLLLGQAIYLITGDVSYKTIQPRLRHSSQKRVIKFEPRRDKAKTLILDNTKLTPENFNKIRRLENK